MLAGLAGRNMSTARLPWRAAGPHARAAATSGASTAPPTGVVELRDYILLSSEFKTFLRLAADVTEARKQIYPGFLGMFSADTGGNVSRVVHLYHFRDLGERDAARRAAAASAGWQRFTDAARSCILTKESTILLQPPGVYAGLGTSCASRRQPQPTAGAGAPQGLYVLHDFRLRPGSAPGAAEAPLEALMQSPAQHGLPAGGEWALVGTAAAGAMDRAVAISRYPSAQHYLEALAGVAHVAAHGGPRQLLQGLTCGLLHPVAFSPWR